MLCTLTKWRKPKNESWFITNVQLKTSSQILHFNLPEAKPLLCVCIFKIVYQMIFH